MSNLFNLKKNSIDNIAIFINSEKTNCYIADKLNKSIIYTGFIIRDAIQVQSICNITFFPSSSSGKFVPRLEFKIINKKTNEEKITQKSFVRISFNNSQEGYEEFWKMIAFLYKYKEIVDLGEFEKVYSVNLKNSYIVEFKNKKEAERIQELKQFGLSIKEIQSILNDKWKTAVDEFDKLLKNKNNYINQYRNNNKILIEGDEAVWHHFLKKNDWMLGLNLNIKFIRDFTDEVTVGINDTENKGAAKTDVLGFSDYTVLVEFKTPKTDIFTEKKEKTARTNTWSFSNEFIDGISQCLGQKFDWDKSCKNKDLKKDSKIMNQNLIRTIDPKTFFIIGNKKREFSEKSDLGEIIIKRDTFKRFRDNNRNLEIITYDELFERAYYIVYKELPNEK